MDRTAGLTQALQGDPMATSPIASACEEWVGRLRRMDELETLRGIVVRRGLVWVVTHLAEHYALTGRDVAGCMERARARVAELEPEHEPTGVEAETVALDDVALAVVARDWDSPAVLVTLAEQAHARNQVTVFRAIDAIIDVGMTRDASVAARHARDSARRQVMVTLEAMERHTRELGMLREAAILTDALEDLRRL